MLLGHRDGVGGNWGTGQKSDSQLTGFEVSFVITSKPKLAPPKSPGRN